MKKGVYYHRKGDFIWLIEKVERYEDLKSDFCIVNGEYSRGRIRKCLVIKKQYKGFVYLGEL